MQTFKDFLQNRLTEGSVKPHVKPNGKGGFDVVNSAGTVRRTFKKQADAEAYFQKKFGHKHGTDHTPPKADTTPAAGHAPSGGSKPPSKEDTIHIHSDKEGTGLATDKHGYVHDDNKHKDIIDHIKQQNAQPDSGSGVKRNGDKYEVHHEGKKVAEYDSAKQALAAHAKAKQGGKSFANHVAKQKEVADIVKDSASRVVNKGKAHVVDHDGKHILVGHDGKAQTKQYSDRSKAEEKAKSINDSLQHGATKHNHFDDPRDEVNVNSKHETEEDAKAHEQRMKDTLHRQGFKPTGKYDGRHFEHEDGRTANTYTMRSVDNKHVAGVSYMPKKATKK